MAMPRPAARSISTSLPESPMVHTLSIVQPRRPATVARPPALLTPGTLYSTLLGPQGLDVRLSSSPMAMKSSSRHGRGVAHAHLHDAPAVGLDERGYVVAGEGLLPALLAADAHVLVSADAVAQARAVGVVEAPGR